jgi:adenine-specific DNA-methyltransferase
MSHRVRRLPNVTSADLADFLEPAETLRQRASESLDPERRASLAQFLTPLPIARLMASMLGPQPKEVRLLDAGAGVGSLTAAAIAELLTRPIRPRSVKVTAVEIDPALLDGLSQTLSLCERACERAGVTFSADIRDGDFLSYAAQTCSYPQPDTYTTAILNPPYFKLRSGSEARRLLSSIGVEVPNVYAGFVAAAIKLLEDAGELVAITPRSFCNGTYFRRFRSLLLDSTTLKRVHIFDSRSSAFREATVLQENIIFGVERSPAKEADEVVLTSTPGLEGPLTIAVVPFEHVVHPGDPERFIHVDADANGHEVAGRIRSLPATLDDLGLGVSTGRVVDFRATEQLRPVPGDDTVPLIYPMHLHGDRVVWPKPEAKKPNAIVAGDATQSLLVADGNFVLVKRFTAKEERRRVVAAVYEQGALGYDQVGFENHLNYFHESGGGLPSNLARGLALYLNTSAVDSYFRRFSGHTQVNATDLRNIRYPSRELLCEVGASWRLGSVPTQAAVDAAAERLLSTTSPASSSLPAPL